MSESKPIQMRLPCEGCGQLHIDEGEFATKPHHTHSCQFCGLTWRPAIEHTVGVEFLPGFKSTEPGRELDPDEEREWLKIKAKVLSDMWSRMRGLLPAAGVDILEISVRSENALSNANIRTLDQLCALTLTQVRRLVGNKRNVQEIRDELRRFGRALSGDTTMARQIAGLPPL